MLHRYPARPSRPGRACLLAVAVLFLFRPHQAAGQAAAPAAAPEPPPRLEASAQFTFLDTRGNADTQSLGAGGDWIFRPTPWTYAAKAVLAQTGSDNDVSARSFAGRP